MAMGMPDSQTMIAGISAVMQAIQTWLAVRDRKRAADAYDNILSIALSDREVAEESYYLNSVVPLHILIALVGRTENCFNRYSDILKSEEAFLPSEVDEATIAVKRCVCRELKRIYELSGSVPPGRLQRWWELYDCENI
jgi:hypothetical protein